MATLMLCLIGFFAGLVGGLLGVGGSIVMIPAMTELLGPQQHLYQAAAMIVNFFVVLPAVYLHRRAGAVMTAVVRVLAPLAIVGVVIGVAASEWGLFQGDGQARLVMLFGLFLLYEAGRNLLRLVRGERRGVKRAFDPQRDRLKAAVIAGLPTGFVAGLLGVGGGAICVPLQNRFLGIPLRNAIANSTAAIVMLSLIGAFTKNCALAARHPDALAESLRLAATLIPTAMVGSWVGSRLMHRLPLKVLRFVFALFLFIAGARMVWHGYDDLQAPPAGTSAPDSAPPAPTGH